MVLCIFGMLDHATLGVVALVCHRFWRLSKDDSLWPRLDLGGRYLRPDVLGYVIQRGTRILRLASTKICSPVFRDTRPVLEDFVCRLEYLDLSECNMSEEDMELFLSKCRHLKKLSLESCELSLGVCSEVANNPNLVTLNLCLCGNLTAEGIDRILTNCKSLRALNVGWAHLSREAIDSLVKNLTDNIEQLNLSGSQNVINDRDLIQLMSRCHKLTELDVSDCLELTTAISSHIVRHLPKLRSISISRCFRINIQQFLSEVCRMRRLERVNAFRHIAADNVSSLEAATPNIRYNQEPFSTIARPTVGIRRTSIWQMRCRE
ncbi:hypothetical protein AAG570_005407 [Ranatra chinensis]|uniref:F-box domain-containing protein n=1 Tax=Ranatra chinensis TaxID=642074 RepID=A0ABD0YF52_9HEMI